ncbi:MAG: aminopeptidase P family protein [Gammaproteobacteria bacterium]|nr:aminopeptidase P family protein [Gammaproteobacteria bacterium]MCH9745065.1 aminopeptidase P family protein [Gammaproteobacteria bacterium]
MSSPSSNEKLTALRQLMQQHQLDYYFVPSADAHYNEYVPDCWNRRSWLTEFNGSAGEALIGLEDAYLWTDPRYFLQAEQQLDASVFTLMKQQQGMAPPIADWLSKHAAGKRVGVDPRLLSIGQADRWQQALQKTGGTLVSIDENLVDQIWADRPALSSKHITLWDEQYAGLTAAEKIEAVRQSLNQQDTNAHVVTMLDAVAWLFNFRGQDIAYNPLAICYALITENKAMLFIDPAKIDAEQKTYFEKYQIECHAYDAIAAILQQETGRVLLETSTASWWIAQQLENATVIQDKSPITLMKAIKNPTEQQGMIEAHRRDGLALCRLFDWLENNWQGQTELTVSAQTTNVREPDANFRGLSFRTISGYAEHGAIIHYGVTQETSIPIGNDSLLLIDSGGQYLNGTTDITRTVHLGTPTDKQKLHYTLVLKGHLALRHCIFPHGTTGEQLNTIAHQFLWQHGLDFGHGTGHGVGCYLCVHEGPQRISGAFTQVPIVPGMVVSNEPGVYLNGQYGIRIENLILTKEVVSAEKSETGHGPFYGFEDLTLVPYARNLIDKNLLTDTEIHQVNQYHEQVQQTLIKNLSGSALEWLKQATKPL